MGHNQFKYGATYEWDDLSPKPTDLGKKELMDYFSSFISAPTHCLSHQAGVRCMVKDLRPILGFHPQFPALGVFGGLSSKGVMSAPFYAHQLASHIVKNTPLDSDVSIFRYV
jgi:glycine/D-amino acid oxidase-like deaminating enzyme